MLYAFITRVLLYITAVSAVLFHNGVAVSYDTAGIVLFFILVPLEMFFGFLVYPGTKEGKQFASWKISLLAAAGTLALLTLFMAGVGATPSRYILYGSLAYLLTVAVFRFKWTFISVVELLFAAGLYVRLINFTRGSEQIAAASQGFSKILLFLAFGALILHAIVLYISSTSRKGKTNRGFRDYAVLAAILVPVLILLALLMPADYLDHSIVFNQLFNKAEPDPEPIDGNMQGDPNGNVRGQSELEGKRGRNGEPGLSGVPSDEWSEDMGTAPGPQKQYSVMVVASKQDPLYLADGYRSRFNPVEGFMKEGGDPLNELVYLRMIETWENPDPLFDQRRLETEVAVFSTIRERVMAYYPVESAPLVYNKRYHPFNYSYESVSDISVTDRWDWAEADTLSYREEQELSRYLDIPLDPASEEAFRAHLDSILTGDENYGGKIMAILTGFRDFQYNVGYTEDVSVGHMRDFITEIKEGDCTEFSNSAAILGRLAGIPSRVVTGYLASSGLQTLSHLYGIYNLRENIPQLQEYPLNELFLVTTSHRHSWPQFYLPEYGWVDFESTDYAIPPPPGGDANDFEVVIPLITEQTVEGRTFQMPWRLILESLAILIVTGTAALYTVQGVFILILKKRAGTPGKEGVMAADRLLMVRLARNGYPPRKRSQTLSEYAEGFDTPEELKEFAQHYNRLRFRLTPGSGEEHRELLQSAAQIAARYKKRGFKAAAARIFSLKGLRYM